MPGYVDQVDRVRRMLDRLKRQDRSPIEYGDDLWSFFQNCWHLKDWIKNDPGVPACVRGLIEAVVADSPPLMICADLANGTKHLKLREPRVGAKPFRWNLLITPGESSKVEYLIDIGSGNQQDGLELARECLLEWERILPAQGLVSRS